MTYDRSQYDIGRSETQRSAHAIVPVLHAMFHPESVIDVGCGEGWWLQEFDILGVNRLVGVEQNGVKLPAGELISHDLEQPFSIHEQFDLALCLETAEHLTHDRAHGLVLDLCHLSDVVVFSAAIPRQGGHNHINEQWQGYWTRIFEGYGFGVNDNLRWMFWGNSNIEVWYRQNILLCMRGVATKPINNVVHPQLWGFYRGLNG